ncbi:MAG: prolipoprotein diacylglyceryl transferase [Peptococcaceae bacterium]|nr:prolipoprotein diacylglyceryl transferase [Peptococcaceae bacterium]
MIDPIALNLGPLEIRWYGVIMAFAFSIGAYLAYRRTVQQKIQPDHILNLIIIIIPAAIIGARIYYVIFSWHNYIESPMEVFAIWHGGLAIHGGIIGGILAGLWYAKKYRLDPWNIADIIAPSLILGQAIGRWGNFINREAYGKPVSESVISHFPEFIKKQMYIDNQYHHPAFFYESVWDLAIFIFLSYYWSLRKNPGEIAALYLITYSLGRIIIEGLRMDSLMAGPVRVAQLISLLSIVAGISIFYFIKKRK